MGSWGCSGLGMGSDKSEHQKAGIMNGNQLLKWDGAWGTSLGGARDLGLGRLLRVYGFDFSRNS